MTVGFGEEEYMTVPERMAAAMGHPARGEPSFWHVCCEAAWIDHNPNPVPCWICGRPTPLTPLKDLWGHLRNRGSEACPGFNGEHTAGTLY
jgi:hypothetical protein